MDTTLADLIKLLLRQNNILCDKEELEFQIKSHPSYPSLHSITGVLDHFNIDNLALDVPVNKTTLSQLPKTFLAQLKTEQGETFAIVINKGLNYEVTIAKKNKRNLKIDKFMEEFTGVMVAVEKTEDTLVNKSKRESVFLVLSILSAIIAGVVLFKKGIGLESSLYLLTSLSGIYISYALIKQELGEPSLLGDTFCSSDTISSQINCNKVLDSKGAQIRDFKLSDLSMSYFMGFTLAIFLLYLTNSSVNFLYAISLLVIPVTLYSIYYQYAIVKQWCLLCLSIVGLLWAQAAFSFYYNDSIEVFMANTAVNNLLIVVFSFLSVFVIWNMSSSRNKLLKELKASKIKYFKFKRDYTLFESLLNNSKTFAFQIPKASEIIFGNKQSNLNLTFITSPFCNHCKSVHTLIESILKKYPDKTQITIRFSVYSANTALVEITSRLLEIYHTKGQIKCLEAMHDIYGDLDAEAWTLKWGVTKDITTYAKTLEQEYQWCNDNSINFTPEILINGKSYPKAYDREDLILFIEELEESRCINDTTITNLEYTTKL